MAGHGRGGRGAKWSKCLVEIERLIKYSLSTLYFFSSIQRWAFGCGSFRAACDDCSGVEEGKMKLRELAAAHTSRLETQEPVMAR